MRVSAAYSLVVLLIHDNHESALVGGSGNFSDGLMAAMIVGNIDLRPEVCGELYGYSFPPIATLLYSLALKMQVKKILI